MGVVGQSGWDSDEGSEDERVIGEDFVGIGCYPFHVEKHVSHCLETHGTRVGSLVVADHWSRHCHCWSHDALYVVEAQMSPGHKDEKGIFGKKRLSQYKTMKTSSYL